MGTSIVDPTVTWSVAGIPGGDATHGTVVRGAYTAPASLPTPNAVTITATSAQDPTKSASATVVLYTVAITPANPSLYFGHSLQFTANVVGIDNPVVQWNATNQITQDGFYTAPLPLSVPTSVDIVSATVIGGGTLVSTSVSLSVAPAVLTSITPDGASAGDTVTITGQDLYHPTGAFFPGPNGVTLAATFQQSSLSEIAAEVPFGSVSGPVYLTFDPLYEGTSKPTNSVAFTRLPNLHIHAPAKDLSSGETMQFSSSLLGADTPTQINWTATSGSFSGSGLYHAPIITSETFDRVTGCLQDTLSCDTVMLRVLPLRITPDTPVVGLGSSIQLDAELGGAPQTAQWSVLAGGGTTTSGGLYTASSLTAKAGPIPISATGSSTSQQTSVAVTGAFPGLVNRIYEYLDFHNNNDPTPEGSFTFTMAAAGNRVYSVDFGGPFANRFSPTYAAIDVYDTTNPGQWAWLGAVESVSTFPMHVFTYGNHLFEVDSGYAVPVPSRISVYSLQGPKPVLTQIFETPPLAFTTVNDGIVYGLPMGPVSVNNLTSVPIYIADVRSGTPVVAQYSLPLPAGDTPMSFDSISGIGNRVYVAWMHQIQLVPIETIAGYDISTSPPTLLSTVHTDVGFRIQVVGSQLLFADARVFDISGTTLVPLTELPTRIVQSVQGNRVLALGLLGDWEIVDVSNPSNPVVTANVADLTTMDYFNNPTAALSGNSVVASDGLGGMAVYDVSVPGGPAGFSGDWAFPWGTTFDQVLQQQMVYAAGETYVGDGTLRGGLSVLDVSSGRPIPRGTLYYPENTGFALQVSGNTVFLGLTNSLKTVDVSNPASPVETASLSIPTNALALCGRTLYVGTGDGRLVVLDVSNPSAPRQIASAGMPGPPNTIRCSGTKVFAADGPYGLLIYDVTNPAAPIFLSQFTANDPVWDVAISGTTALIAADASGLLALDISNPVQVKQLSQTVLPSVNPFPPPMSGSDDNPAVSISIQNGLAYVGTSFGFIFGFDVDRPANPRLLALNLIGGTIRAINALGNNLFIAADGVEMQLDNTLPYNSIQSFYPLAALSDPSPITDRAAAINTIWNKKGKGAWARRRGLGGQRSLNRTPIPSLSDCLARSPDAFSKYENFWQKLSFWNACRHSASRSRDASANRFGVVNVLR